MRSTRRFLGALIFGIAVLQSVPALLAANGTGMTAATLLVSQTSARPGSTVMAALRLVSEPGWHTYWRNPGDAGIPTSVEWELPAGVSVGEFQWPVPQKLLIAGLSAYVYEGETLLLFPIKVAADVPPGSLTIKGAATWLECSDRTCVPGGEKVEAKLTVGDQPVPSPDSQKIEEWKAKIPKALPEFSARASWDGPPQKKVRAFIIEWAPAGTVGKPDFYPFASDQFTIQSETEVLQADAKLVRVRKKVEISGTTWPDRIAGVTVDQAGPAYPMGHEVSVALTGSGTIASAANQSGATAGGAGVIELPGNKTGPASLWAVLGFAFLGGLILNIMPCVLPVIALKILGFVNQSREEPRRVRQLGILYMFGVLTSFLVLAGVIVGVKRAGGPVNWGMQMQNPYFVVGMTAIITLVALNLWGVFEITVSGRALGAASELAGREGPTGAFYNGILTTLLATPCTAPALTFAVGSVLTQSAGYIIATFLMIGFGLGLPYLLLSMNPRWLKILPKPGAWMERFKIAMGFPIAATAIWLLSLSSTYFGDSGTLWVGLFLVFLGLAAWIYGEFVQRGSAHRTFAAVLSVLVLGCGYFYTLESELNWRSPQSASSGGELHMKPGEIPWERWSSAAVEEARQAGRPVLVDFTARWCFTCQVNKKTSLEIDSVKKRIAELNVLPLIGDFTAPNPLIAKEIEKFKRAGVPLVIVYPPDPAASPIVLPEILTPGIVLNALEMASTEAQTRLGQKIASGR